MSEKVINMTNIDINMSGSAYPLCVFFLFFNISLIYLSNSQSSALYFIDHMNRVSLFLICCRLLAIHSCIPFYEMTESLERK